MRRLMIPIIAISIAVVPATIEAQRPNQAAGQRPAATARGQVADRIADPIQRILDSRDELSLTSAQVTRIERVRTQLATQNRPLMVKVEAVLPEGARMAGAPQMRERMRARQDSVGDLTEEQRRELRTKMDARRDSMRGNADTQRDRIRARADSMTPEQRAKLREKAGDMRPERAGAMAGQMEEIRPLMEQIRDNTQKAMEQVEGVLTARQREKLRDLRPAAQPRRGGGR